MSTVSASARYDQFTVTAAERCWYDTSRWREWVDGLERVVAVEGDWPAPGAAVTWESVPAGRGHVVERVTVYEDQTGQVLEVRDDSLTGRQSVSFAAAGEGVQIVLALEYRITKRSLITPVVDVLFVRRAMTASLERTLARFGAAVTSG
jgi:Polyketide cyclase / dehydrase and lipid transport